MADTPTKIEDVIYFDDFNPYYREMSTRVNAFFASGVAATVPEVEVGSKGGVQVQMPFWQALGERAQLLDDKDDLEIRKVDSGQDTAVLHARALVYGATDLAGALAGDDPMDAIAAGVAENWSMEFNEMTFSTLKGSMGALAAEDPSVNTLDISALGGGAANIDGESFIDALQTLGDAKAKIVAVGMHSAVESHLAKNNLIEYIKESEGSPSVPFFMGKRVIVDDANMPTNGVFDSWLFGPGAIGFVEGSPKVPSETDREALKGGGQEFLVTRRHFVMHPRGIRWTPKNGVPAKLTPSDAELQDPENWTRAWQPKNIRIVRFQHRIAGYAS